MPTDPIRDLKIATIFLTRLPVRLGGRLAMRDLAAAAYAFPLAGVIVGACGALAFWIARDVLTLPPTPSAVLAIGATAIVTGALHEDGLADTADALGVADRARALEVMRDSRIGSFGATALLLALMARVTALAALPGPAVACGALVAAAAVSRALLPVVMRAQPSARAAGLAAEAGRPEPARVATGLVLALLAACIALPPGLALPAAAAAALVGLAAAALLGRRFGGTTGDTLGAVQQAAEIAFLYALLA